MNFRDKLLLDLPQSGASIGRDHIAQARWDIRAAGIFASLCRHTPADVIPEKAVHYHLVREFCNPASDHYLFRDPLPEGEPQVGLTRKERFRRECAKWFQAAAGGYLPVALSEDQVTADARRDVRLVQLASEGHPDFTKAYIAAHGEFSNE